MKPLTALSKDEANGLRGLLFDLDDTVLTHGLLTREAYAALWRLHEAGLRLVAVTGRPSGWGEVVARQWPVDGVVTENGAITVVREGRGVAVLDPVSAEVRAERRAMLAALVAAAAQAVPEAQLSDDARARRTDVTWDLGERAHLPEATVRTLVKLAHGAGARTTRSSVHLHATFDAEDKASGTVAFLHRAFGDDRGASLAARYAFAGDSGNDAACFAAFRITFGVRNVTSHLAHLPVTPRYVAPFDRGAGFAAIADALLAARG